MDDLIIESTGNIEYYTNVDDLNVDNPDPVDAVPDSTYYVYQSVPEEVEEYKEDIQGEDLKEEDKEEDKEEEKEVEKEEEKEEENDVQEVQYVYIKSDSVLDDYDINNRNSSETVSVNDVQYLIDTPLNEYRLTDSLITIIIFMGLFVGMIYCIKRTVFKWN